MKIQALILMFLMVLTVSGCEGDTFASSPEIRGRVIDATSHHPIEGAIVYALWEAEVKPRTFTGGFTRSACYHAEAATTDSRGQFVLQSWQDELSITIKKPDVAIRAYKLGYRVIGPDRSSTPNDAGVTFAMAELPADAEQQLQEMRTHLQFCIDAGASRRNLFPLLRTLYYDARRLATTPAQLVIVGQLRDAAASVGSESGRDDTNQSRHERKQRFLEEHLQ